MFFTQFPLALEQPPHQGKDVNHHLTKSDFYKDANKSRAQRSSDLMSDDHTHTKGLLPRGQRGHQFIVSDFRHLI